MASRRKKRGKHGGGGVKMDMAAMLDMAFQLLTFFILTFKPAPVEGEVRLRLPPPQPITQKAGQSAGNNAANNNPASGLETLVISAFAKPTGALGQMAIGESQIGSTSALDRRLSEILADPVASFEQVVIQVDNKLNYEGLMQVVDVCTRQKLANGEKLTKLSFIAAGEAP
ncbi:ExbD/TolR family protein [Anatilimnocola floriformis]|uniref:ExbD/TolR family protein n=1 Tax=Anatilimnocola floriformis TaxID=2948575 RepID=UPI0020C413D8|nr:biopolymer transporter ExbD [Anatilimnocola floriformis]